MRRGLLGAALSGNTWCQWLGLGAAAFPSWGEGPRVVSALMGFSEGQQRAGVLLAAWQSARGQHGHR